MNPRPKLSYMNSIPIERLSPHKLSQPPLQGLKLQTKYTFMEQEDPINTIQPPKPKTKKKKRKGKKKATKRKTLPPITLNTPSLKDLEQYPPVDIEELKSPIKLGSPMKKKRENVPVRPEEKVLEEDFLDFEINAKDEADDLNDLIAEEIKKLEEQKEQILELETHVTKEINVIFEPEEQKPGKKVNESDMLFSMFKDFHCAKTKSPDPRVAPTNAEYSVVNDCIKQRLQELEKRKMELDGFRDMIRQCVEKEKLEDDDVANDLEDRFNQLRAENDFLETYKNIKDKDKDQKEEMSKLKNSIMNDKSIYKESKNSLMRIRQKVQQKQNAQISKEDVRKAKDGLKHELVGMMSSMRNSNCLIDFGKN